MSEEVKGLSDEDEHVDDYEEDDEQEEEQPKKKKSKKTDLMKMTGNLITNINYKVAFLLFVFGMIIFSDVFIDGVIGKFNDSVDGECTTSKGTMLQLMFLVFAYIFADLLVTYEVL